MTGNVIVTGAAGFLGSHVVSELADNGFRVVNTDIRIPPGNAEGWRKADLRSYQDLLDLTREATAVCHIGGIGDVYAAESDPSTAMHTNACGSLNLLEACLRNNVRKFVYASTWEVYGPPQYQPIDEGHPCSPTHPYAISKLVGEMLARSYSLRDSMDVAILRIGTAYGPRMRDNAVMPVFIRKAIAGEPITIQGKGDQFRQFTQVRDISRAFRLAIEAEAPLSIYNIVSPERTTISELAEWISSRFPVDIVYSEARPRDAPPAILTAARARAELGWEARVQVREGLSELINLYAE